MAPIWIGAVFALSIGVPFGTVVLKLVGAAGEHGLSDASVRATGWDSLARTGLYAGGIALLAVLVALPFAIVVSRGRTVWYPVLAVPMLLPSYLAYAAWSIARAPTTWVGGWIAAAPERGQEWIPLVASRSLAVWGLALWAWPLAALVIAMSLRTTGSQIDHPLRLDCMNDWQRLRARLGAARPGLLTAWVLVALLMLGSAVPLHVARVETYAIRLWTVLDSHPTEPWRAWLAAWPLAVLAVGASWVLSGRLVRLGTHMAALDDPSAAPAHSVHRAWGLRVARWAVAVSPWVLSVVVPLGLFWWSMGDPRMLGIFLDRTADGLATSLAVGAVVGTIAGTICVSVAHTAGTLHATGRGRTLLRWLLAACLAWSLLPGVLTGSAVAGAARLVPDAVRESVLPMVGAHLSRCLFLPVMAGLWLAAGEARVVGESRRLDGATGLFAWLRTAWRTVLGPSIAVGLACLCLSVHEIESSLQVQTPGIDHLAQRLLQWLHYERTAELSAAGVLLLGLGVAGSVVTVLLTWWHGKRTPGDNRR